MAKDKTPATYEARDYIVVDQPFYDGVVLHPIGSRVTWAGPQGQCLHPVDAPARRSTTEAPVFPDPLSGRGDKRKVEAGKALEPVILVQ